MDGCIAAIWRSCGGGCRGRKGAIDARLGRSQANRTKIAVVRGEAGRSATDAL